MPFSKTARNSLAFVGCAVVLTGASALLFVAGRFVVVALGIVALFGVLHVLRARWWFARLANEFRHRHPNKRLLVVYTDSPHWKPVIEGDWATRWASDIVLFNRSSPWTPSDLEARLWFAVRGREHTPLALVLLPDGKRHVIRLFRAFRDYKHGKDIALRRAERQIGELLRSAHEP